MLSSHLRDDAEETPDDFDPLFAQADRLPASIKGSEGGGPQQHVRDVEDQDDLVNDGFEEELGGGINRDMGSFTAD